MNKLPDPPEEDLDDDTGDPVNPPKGDPPPTIPDPNEND